MVQQENKSTNALPRALPEFEQINRYWDNKHGFYGAKILPGEYYVTKQEETIVTVLGSCISACIRDRVSGIGGMNHFMLPDAKGNLDTEVKGTGLSAAMRYGSYAMEHLINDILKHGGRRKNLEAKICGGGKILARMTDVGNKNITFVKQYLDTEGIEVTSEDLGDIFPRKVQYTPKSGKLRIKKLRSLHNNTIIEREIGYQHEIEEQPVAGSVELF